MKSEDKKEFEGRAGGRESPALPSNSPPSPLYGGWHRRPACAKSGLMRWV
jgi:hypothetical protein